jgi:hypothetical protein
LVVEHSRDGLPDSYSSQVPPSIAAATGRVMEKQVELVRGGEQRLRRAVVARWRARNQRNEWLENDLAAAAELDQFDRRLIEVWGDRFGPMKDDCDGLGDDECRRRGLDLLDWSHLHAPSALPPIRPLWPHAYLVQGSLQQFAEQVKVGWHPNFQALLKAMGVRSSDASR